MELAQQVVVGIGLAKLAERSLEVVVLQGHVVVVGGLGTLVFLQGVEHTIGVGASMIHIIAQQVAATAQFHQCHSVGIFGIDVGTTVIGRHHPSAEFTGEVGIVVVALGDGFFLFAQLFGGDSGGTAEGFEIEGLVVVACCGFDATVPESIGIVAIKRNHLSKGNGGAQFGPAGTGIEREVEATVVGNLLQGHEVGAFAPVLIIKLTGDDRAAIFPLQSLHLGENLPVEQLGIVHEGGVLFTHLASLAEHPVGDATIAHLTVTEGTQAQDDWHIFLLTDFEETSQITLAAPVEDAFLFLNVVPEDIGGEDGHASFFHLSYFVLPLAFGQT